MPEDNISKNTNFFMKSSDCDNNNWNNNPLAWLIGLAAVNNNNGIFGNNNGAAGYAVGGNTGKIDSLQEGQTRLENRFNTENLSSEHKDINHNVRHTEETISGDIKSLTNAIQHYFSETNGSITNVNDNVKIGFTALDKAICALTTDVARENAATRNQMSEQHAALGCKVENTARDTQDVINRGIAAISKQLSDNETARVKEDNDRLRAEATKNQTVKEVAELLAQQNANQPAPAPVVNVQGQSGEIAQLSGQITKLTNSFEQLIRGIQGQNQQD